MAEEEVEDGVEEEERRLMGCQRRQKRRRHKILFSILFTENPNFCSPG